MDTSRRDHFGTSIHGSSTSTSHRPAFPRTVSESRILTTEELDKIGACDLLNREPAYNGFLYKRAKEKVTDRFIASSMGSLKWQLRYVVLYQHQVIYYKNERASGPQGSFSLKGYNRVLRSVEMESADQQWAFKLIGLRADDRTWYFAAASEREMKLWMAHFKVAMEECLHGQAKDRSMKILTDLKTKSDAENKQSTHPLNESRQSVISTESLGSFEPGIYEDIESEVGYDDTVDDVRIGSGNDGPPPRERALPQRPDGLSGSPKSNQWCGSLQRPTLPTRSPMPRRASETSVSSGDDGGYIQPNDLDDEENNDRPTGGIISRRPGPEGKSFHGKPFEEKPVTELTGKPPPTKPKPPPPVTSRPGRQMPRAHSLEYHQDVEELLPSTAVINKCDKTFCEGLLKKYQQEGMYLLRMAGDMQGKVLMVWCAQEQKSKHYKVFGDNISDFGLDQTPRFSTMTALLTHYYKNNLPNSMFSLTQPYRR